MDSMTYTAIVPVKTLTSAKSRLSPYLTQSQRQTVVLDMLDHVLHVLLASRLLERVSVVSPDARVLEQAAAWGAQALLEEQQGHNPALHAAALRERAGGATSNPASTRLCLRRREIGLVRMPSSCGHHWHCLTCSAQTVYSSIYKQPGNGS